MKKRFAYDEGYKFQVKFRGKDMGTYETSGKAKDMVNMITKSYWNEVYYNRDIIELIRIPDGEIG